MGIINYLRETKGELGHVNWPSRKQSIVFSVVVIVVSLITAILLGLFDVIFSKIINLLII